MIGDRSKQTDENLLEALRLMENLFDEYPGSLNGLGGSISQMCEHARRRLTELLSQQKPEVLH